MDDLAMRNYLLLLSLTAANKASGKRLLANLHAKVDQRAKPLWFDASHVGIALTTDMPAIEVWGAAFVGIKDFNDALIVELGSDWIARRESNYDHWMTTHLGHPLPKRRS